mmetsp:Transcript_121913/g.356282  ORF Transcript_121913/g.356282 Transcript_121913/m.356282 type:complete len:270 (-) Transcript_121913:122-931(-)
MLPWYTGKFLPNGLYNADKGSYYDQLTFPHLCALKPTMPQPSPVNAPNFVNAAKFISCDMGYVQSANGHTEGTMRSCAEQSGLALEPLELCMHTDEGYNIMRGSEYSAKIHSVLDRTIESAPYLFVNGEMLVCPGFNYCTATWVPQADGQYGNKPLPQHGSFLTVVCSMLNPAPAACRAALSGAQPKAVKPTPACENCAEVLPSRWRVVDAAPSSLTVHLLAAAGMALVVAAAACFAWRRAHAARGAKAGEASSKQFLSVEAGQELLVE